MARLYSLVITCFLLATQLKVQSVTETDSMVNRRANHQSQKLNNGSVLTFGGETDHVTGDGNDTTYVSAEIYNNGVWTPTGSMHMPRTQFASSLLLDGKVLAIGGVTSDYEYEWASCEIYDPGTGLWTYTDSLDKATGLNYALLMQNGKVLEADGDSSYVYDPAPGTWGSGAAMAVSHGTNLVLVSLANGKVIAVGGQDCLNCAEVYDPTANTWTLTANTMQYSHIQATAVLLNNGNVLVAGSSSVDSGQTESELYNPSTNRFTTSGALLSNISSCPGVLLDNGNVLVWGQGDIFSTTNSTQSLQVYNAATGTWSAPVTTIYGTSNYTMVKLSNNVVLVMGGAIFGEASWYCYLINGNDVAGVQTIPAMDGFELAPNPGVGSFTLNADQPHQVATLRVSDLLGNTKEVITQDWTQPVNMTEVASGVYLIVLYDKDGAPVGVQKWVKL